MKIRGHTLFLLMCSLIFFSRPSYASTDYLEVGLEVANGVVTKVGEVQEEITSNINKIIAEKMAKIAGDYMQMKKKLKKAERIKERMERAKERLERIKKRAEKFKKRRETLMKKAAKLQEKVAKIQERYNEAKTRVEEKVAEVQKGVAELKEKADEAKALIEEGKEKVSDGAEFIKEAKTSINDVVGMAEGIKNEAESKLNELNSDINNIRNKVKSSLPVSYDSVNHVAVMPDADNIGELAMQTATDVELADSIDVDAVLKTSVSADEIMELSEIGDVEAIEAATKIGQVNIQDQLQNLNKSKAKNEVAKKGIVLEGKTPIKSNRKIFGLASEKLDSTKAMQDLMQEAINE